MKYKIGSKVIIKKLRRQGVIESHAREYGDWYVKRLDSVGRDYFEDELKPLPEKKEKYCYCVCHCDHEGGCIRGQKECYHCKKVEKPKEECICDLGSPNQEVCPKHSKSKECKHYFKVFEGTCSKCGINRSMKDNPTLSPVKSSEERIEELEKRIEILEKKDTIVNVNYPPIPNPPQQYNNRGPRCGSKYYGNIHMC